MEPETFVTPVTFQPVAKRRWPLYLAVFLLSLLVASLAMFPMAALRSWLPLPPGLQLKNVSGTIWNGHATLTDARTNRAMPPIATQVRLLPVKSLLALTPVWQVHLRIDNDLLSGRVHLAQVADASQASSSDQLALVIEHLNGAISVGSPWWRHYIPVVLGGQVTLSSSRLVLTRMGPWDGDAAVVWRDASLETSDKLSLGKLQGTMAVKSGRIEARLHSSQGDSAPLRLHLDVSGALKTGLHLKGEVGPGSAASAPLKRDLRMLGRPNAGGMITLSRTFRLGSVR